METSETLQIRVHGLMQTILLLATLPFITGIISILLCPTLGSIIPALFAVLIVWFLWALARSTLAANRETITVSVPYGNFRMRWDDVRKIITDGELFSFQGDDKHLSVSLKLAGKGKREFQELLKQQVEQHGILVEQTARVPLLHQNTRVK